MPHSTGLRGRELIKGHATLNDFLMLVDPSCEVAVSGADIAAVCDRHGGIGADGFVRVVRTTALPGAGAFAAAVPEAEWFMDYYNADGSVAEMCGNVTRLGDLWTVDMGPARLTRPRQAQEEGWDMTVVVPGLMGERAALSVEMPNPHAVVALGEENELEAASFAGLTDSAAPVVYNPPLETGTNLELVVPLGEEIDPDTQAPVGIARMRVLERGVGETLSCGTGCCAVAVALHTWTGPGAPEDYRILVPGGQIGVHVGADPLAEDSTVLLTGPATITGRVTIA